MLIRQSQCEGQAVATAPYGGEREEASLRSAQRSPVKLSGR
jgi:hypothetical protein